MLHSWLFFLPGCHLLDILLAVSCPLGAFGETQRHVVQADEAGRAAEETALRTGIGPFEVPVAHNLKRSAAPEGLKPLVANVIPCLRLTPGAFRPGESGALLPRRQQKL